MAHNADAIIMHKSLWPACLGAEAHACCIQLNSSRSLRCCIAWQSSRLTVPLLSAALLHVTLCAVAAATTQTTTGWSSTCLVEAQAVTLLVWLTGLPVVGLLDKVNQKLRLSKVFGRSWSARETRETSTPLPREGESLHPLGGITPLASQLPLADGSLGEATCQLTQSQPLCSTVFRCICNAYALHALYTVDHMTTILVACQNPYMLG